MLPPRIIGRTFPIVLSAIASLSTYAPAATIIGFEDRLGMSPPFVEGTPVPQHFIVTDDYLSLGVVFESSGGGILISAPTNPVSGLNVASPTAPGPVIGGMDPVTATFFVGSTDILGVTDSVSVTLTSSTSESFLSALDVNGSVIATDSGAASSTLTVISVNQIHSIELSGGPFAFDEFTFEGLRPIPEPSSAVLFGLACSCLALRRRHSSPEVEQGGAGQPATRSEPERSL